MASMFPTPNSIFNSGGSVDWAATEVLVKKMVSYLNSETDCCGGKNNPTMCKVNILLTAMEYDAPDDLDNDVRWHDDIKSVYLYLWPLT